MSQAHHQFPWLQENASYYLDILIEDCYKLLSDNPERYPMMTNSPISHIFTD